MARQRKAKTAYELCERVCEAIKAKPLAYYQADWVKRGEVRPDELRVPENTCDTAFCRGGWLVAVHDGKNHEHASGPGAIHTRAYELLGVRNDGVGEPLRLSVVSLFLASAVGGRPGSKAYVREGIAGMRRFMREHKAHLQARSLRGV